MQILKIPIYTNQNSKLFGFIFHDVLIKLTKISVFIKYDIFL